MEELKPFFTFLDRVKYSSELAAHQGWTKADKLPEGWMKRISEASNHVLFLSPQGRVFQNKASVTMFLNGGQVDEEVLGETKEVKMKGMEVKEEDWLEDASLPTGWSLRMTSDKSKLIRAPGGKMYTTRLDAIKSLLELPQFWDCNYFTKLKDCNFQVNFFNLKWLGRKWGLEV